MRRPSRWDLGAMRGDVFAYLTAAIGLMAVFLAILGATRPETPPAEEKGIGRPATTSR